MRAEVAITIISVAMSRGHHTVPSPRALLSRARWSPRPRCCPFIHSSFIHSVIHSWAPRICLRHCLGPTAQVPLPLAMSPAVGLFPAQQPGPAFKMILGSMPLCVNPGAFLCPQSLRQSPALPCGSHLHLPCPPSLSLLQLLGPLGSASCPRALVLAASRQGSLFPRCPAHCLPFFRSLL